MDNLKAADDLIVINFLSKLIFFDRSIDSNDEEATKKWNCICTD